MLYLDLILRSAFLTPTVVICLQTNPSLVYAAARLPEYKAIVDNAIEYSKKSGLTGVALNELLLDKVRTFFLYPR